MIGSLAARFKRRRRPPGGAAATTKTRAKKEPLMGVGEQTTDASHSRNSDQMTKKSSGGDTPARDGAKIRIEHGECIFTPITQVATVAESQFSFIRDPFYDRPFP